MRDDIAGLLSRPAGKRWWDRQGWRSLSTEFRAAIEALIAEPPPRDAPADD